MANWERGGRYMASAATNGVGVWFGSDFRRDLQQLADAEAMALGTYVRRLLAKRLATLRPAAGPGRVGIGR